jgi:hypothetical protein
MSHVATVDIHITNLADLRVACNRLGLELAEGQTAYRWYGRHVGDFPLPAGFRPDELGKCEHAIRIPGNETAYEVGVVPRRDGKPGWTLLWDFWCGGYGLQAKIGQDAGLLKQAYAIAAATRQARLQGFNVQEQQLAKGQIKLVLTR